MPPLAGNLLEQVVEVGNMAPPFKMLAYAPQCVRRQWALLALQDARHDFEKLIFAFVEYRRVEQRALQGLGDEFRIR